MIRFTSISLILFLACSSSYTFGPARTRRANVHFRASVESNQEDDSELDLSNWRQFRASLINTSTTPASTMDVDNASLLRIQNPNSPLLQTPLTFSHRISTPEVASVCLRMPFAHEVFVNARNDTIRSLASDLNINFTQAEQYCETSAYYWYKKVDGLLTTKLNSIAINSFSRDSLGRQVLNPSDLSDEDRNFLADYSDAVEEWESVFLILSERKSLVLNRPLSQKLDSSLCRSFLFGQKVSDDMVSIDPTTFEARLLFSFESAFGCGVTCPVYYGGDVGLENEPGVLVHPFSSLTKSWELSPGCGLFLADGLSAINECCDLVKSEGAVPLDFRLFLGKTHYRENDLFNKVREGKYIPLSVSKNLVLKQCLQLPKPLFCELSVMAGGQIKEISDIELAKRSK